MRFFFYFFLTISSVVSFALTPEMTQNKPVIQMDKSDFMALGETIESGDIEKFKNLLDKVEAKMSPEEIELLKYEILYTVTALDKVSFVKFLIDQNLNVNYQYEYDITLLHLAAFTPSEKSVEFLLQQKDIDVNALDTNYNTPLIYASYLQPLLFTIDGPEKNILNQLITRKDIDINATNILKISAVQMVVNKKNLEAAKILLTNKKINLNIQDRIGWNPLHNAVYSENEKMVKLLLKHGADPNVKTRSERETHTLTKNPKVLKYLKQKKCKNSFQ